METSRRRFIDWLLGLGVVGFLGSILYPLLDYLNPPQTAEARVNSVKVGKVDQFPPNTGKVFKFGNEPAIIVRTEGGEFHAMTAVCTHLSCTVQYRSDLKLIWCPCHNGRYDVSGAVISGPPPRPLQQYKVVVKNDEVYVARGEA